MINFLSRDSIIHPGPGNIYNPGEIAKIFDFPEDEIIRLSEYHRMHAVQLEGQWRIYASVLSPFNSDFKTMPLWFQKWIPQQGPGKK